jgi:hypothetical protein
MMKMKSGYKAGGKLNMVKGPNGKMVPDYAADGKGKMMGGGKVMKYQAGGMSMAEDSTRGAPGVLDLEEMKRRNTRRPMPSGAMNRMEGPTPDEMRKNNKEKKKRKKRVGMKSGGQVRGCGIAERGVRKAKMY